MDTVKYSIIIPHKNSPSLLTRCVASIPKRDDLQVIVVDDNSDPSIVDFDNFPIKNDENTIIVFDKSGKGAGRARNIGLEKATGEKIIFADADDFFNYCFNEILDEYKNDTSDIVFFNASSCDSKTYVNHYAHGKFRNELFEGYLKNPQLYEYYLRYECGAPWGKIIRKDLIENNHVKFEESIINNDTRFSYMTGHLAKSIQVDQRAIYCYTYSPSSISFTMNDEKYLTHMHIIAQQIVFCKPYRQNFSSYKSYPFNYLRKKLVILHQANKKDLYNECLKILDSYGLGKELKKAVQKRILYIKVGGLVLRLARRIKK